MVVTVGFELLATEIKKTFLRFCYVVFRFLRFYGHRLSITIILFMFNLNSSRLSNYCLAVNSQIIGKLVFVTLFCITNLKLSGFQLTINFISTTSERDRIKIKTRDEYVQSAKIQQVPAKLIEFVEFLHEFYLKLFSFFL